jgi:aryl-alcohol dehydrogenase-like predicted oxidoreductase
MTQQLELNSYRLLGRSGLRISPLALGTMTFGVDWGWGMATRPGDPNSGGNHRKSTVRSVEESLKRLRIDHIDLLYLHIWDGTTPVEEILRALDDLVRQGKVLYLGFSDTPAWQVSRMQAIAELRLKVSLSDEDRERLEAVSAIELGFPHDLLRRPRQSMR